ALLMTALAFSPASAAGLEGDWETVISSPRRPWIFETHFERRSDAWKGVMTIHGLGDLPLSDVRASSDRVHFVFPPELDSMVFEGTFRDSGIAGQVIEEGKSVAALLTPIVTPPEPADRNKAWRQDLEYASKRMNAYERSFTPRTRKAFTSEMARIESDLPHEDDAQIL